MLTTVKNVKSYLNIANDDEFIQQLIKYAQATIEGYCNRKFESSEYVEEVQIIKNRVFTNNFPIKEVAELVVDGNAVTNYKTLPTCIVLNDKSKTMTGGYAYLESATKTAIVTYIAGYESFELPQDLVFACTKLTAYYYKEAREDRLGVEQEKMDVMSTNYLSTIPETIIMLLKPHRKVSF